MSDSTLGGGIGEDAPEAHHPKHRRDGVPLDGAPDLGLYTAPSPIVSEPVTPSAWAAAPIEHVAPSPEPPAYPPAPTVSEFQYPGSPNPIADFEGENPDTGAAG
jgi:hypothetical protein